MIPYTIDCLQIDASQYLTELLTLLQLRIIVWQILLPRDAADTTFATGGCSVILCLIAQTKAAMGPSYLYPIWLVLCR